VAKETLQQYGHECSLGERGRQTGGEAKKRLNRQERQEKRRIIFLGVLGELGGSNLFVPDESVGFIWLGYFQTVPVRVPCSENFLQVQPALR
jgi:hypothetical protein